MIDKVTFNDTSALSILLNKTNTNKTSNLIFNSNFNFPNYNEICNKQIVINNKTYSIDEKNILNTIAKFSEENDISLFQAIFEDEKIPEEKKIEYLDKIKQNLISYIKNSSNTYTDNILKNIDNTITNMREKGIHKYSKKEYILDINTLIDRYLLTEIFKILNSEIENIEELKNKGLIKNSTIEKIYKNILAEPLTIDTLKIMAKNDMKSSSNGKLDNNFDQYWSSNCWMIASLKAILNNEEATEELHSLINHKENGDIEITLKGPSKKYVITQEELVGSKEYSIGDLDARAIEIAFDKYIREENSNLNGFKKFIRCFHKNRIDPFPLNCNEVIDTSLRQTFSILFGKENLNNIYYDDTKPNNTVINNIKNGNRVTVIASLNDSLDYQFGKNTNGKDIKLDSHHVYSVNNIENDSLVIFDPRNNKEKIKISQNTFLKYFDYTYQYK